MDPHHEIPDAGLTLPSHAASNWRPAGGGGPYRATHTSPLLRYLSSSACLSEAEIGELRHLLHFIRQHAGHTELCTEGDIQQPRILLTGWACQQRLLRNGRRQIIRFLIPGDLIGSLDWPAQPILSSVVALTPGTLADARPILQAAHAPDEANKGFSTLIRNAVRAEKTEFRDHIVRLGGLTAYKRLVHLVLELHGRLRAAGLADSNTVVLPITQETIGDAIGLSFVHTNRVLQQIRRDGLFTIRAGVLTIHDLERMQEIAEWADD